MIPITIIILKVGSLPGVVGQWTLSLLVTFDFTRKRSRAMNRPTQHCLELNTTLSSHSDVWSGRLVSVYPGKMRFQVFWIQFHWKDLESPGESQWWHVRRLLGWDAGRMSAIIPALLLLFELTGKTEETVVSLHVEFKYYNKIFHCSFRTFLFYSYIPNGMRNL